MKRIIYAITLIGCLFLGTQSRNVLAQAIVSDVQNTATNTLNGIRATTDAFSQLTSMFESLDVATEHMKKFEEFKEAMSKLTDDIANAQKFINEINDFAHLFQALERNILTLKTYGEMIKSSAGEEFNEYYLSNLINQTVALGKSAEYTLQMISTIISESGLTKGERQQLISDKTKEAEQKIEAMGNKLQEELANLKDTQEGVALVNFTLGRQPKDGLKGIGAQSTDFSQSTSSSQTSTNLGLSEAGASETVVLKEGDRIRSVTYSIILIIIGISCLGSLIFAFARYATGAHEADKTFARIFALVIIILVVFSIISQFVFGVK